MDFCRRAKTNPVQTTINVVLTFLTELHLDGSLQYSSLNTARSALSTFVIVPGGVPVGQHPLICRFMKGVFNLHPPRPRYSEMWDASLVLNYLRRISPAEKTSLKELTLKLCMLIALVSAQRQQTIHLLRTDKMKHKSNSVICYVDELLKQSKPGNTGIKVEFKAM